jgi:AcrR family transcriptional regulator
VDALLALQEEGDLSPTAQQVAARAGVALRTVFGHFSDMETLWAEAGQRELAKLEGLAEVIDPDLPLAERIDRFSASRGRVLEALMPVMRAARLREPSSPQLLKNRELYNKVGDDEVAGVRARARPARRDGPGAHPRRALPVQRRRGVGGAAPRPGPVARAGGRGGATIRRRRAVGLTRTSYLEERP